MSFLRRLSARVPLTSSIRGFHASSKALDSATTVATPEAPKYSIVRHPQSDSEVDSKSLFAVVGLNGTQYKLTQGDILNAQHLPEAKVGEIMDLDKVLLIGSPNETIVGRPYIEGAKVQARVEEQTLDAKTIVFKMKRRKGYRRKQGHRRKVTILRITDILPQIDLNTSEQDN